MKETGKDSSRKAFCTFCIASVDASRIRGHLRRCTDRRLDIDEAGIHGERIRSFLLLLKLAGFPEQWLALEVHETTRLVELQTFIRRLWFPEFPGLGNVTPACRRWKDLVEERGKRIELAKVSELFQVKDRFRFSFVPGNPAASVEIEVFAYGEAGVRHLPVDIVAFPSGTGMGRKPVSQVCPWLLQAQ
ncbi:MAG: hypothetical protein Kow00109_20180 [Acidobacteriota bacterium]